jgi:hypothetical protein
MLVGLFTPPSLDGNEQSFSWICIESRRTMGIYDGIYPHCGKFYTAFSYVSMIVGYHDQFRDKP